MEYYPEVYNIQNLDEAKKTVLPPSKNESLEERWEKEAEYNLKLIEGLCKVDSSTKILDYGCGVGRLAKHLIQKYNCLVIGVDISLNMRALATVYVNSANFIAVAPQILDQLGIKYDLALAVWVLQHTYDPQQDLNLINSVLSGKLFVLNSIKRYVPVKTDQGVFWGDDGIDMRMLLEKSFVRSKFAYIDIDGQELNLPEENFYGYYENLTKGKDNG